MYTALFKGIVAKAQTLLPGALVRPTCHLHKQACASLAHACVQWLSAIDECFCFRCKAAPEHSNGVAHGSRRRRDGARLPLDWGVERGCTRALCTPYSRRRAESTQLSACQNKTRLQDAAARAPAAPSSCAAAAQPKKLSRPIGVSRCPAHGDRITLYTTQDSIFNSAFIGRVDLAYILSEARALFSDRDKMKPEIL